MDMPEKKNPTEALDVQSRMAETLAGKRPVDERTYPYFPPEYAIPFLHIGTDKQLFLDNFILDHLEDVTRVFPAPQRPEKPIIGVGDLPWEEKAREVPNIMLSGIVHDPDDGKYKIWYILSLSGDPFSEGQVLCYAESTDCLHLEKPLVEILDPYFKPYPGFAAADCDLVYADDPQQIWHTVHWQGNSDVRSLWNKPCRLRFDLHQASLYAFQFG
ncbi:MAG: hypothetical protein HY326_13155 [Chloroflexi bacterium]|nr:hypothetical protein [Chloroflexota bacterium]